MGKTVNANIYYNEYFDEEVALFIDGEFVVRGDEYHDKINDFIDGVLFGVELCGHIVEKDTQSINSDNEMFAQCEFQITEEEDLEDD